MPTATVLAAPAAVLPPMAPTLVSLRAVLPLPLDSARAPETATDPCGSALLMRLATALLAVPETVALVVAPETAGSPY